MNRGDRLKILRILCGQSQDALAKILGLSQGNVATWERKGMFPRDSETAKRLAEVLQAPIGYLAFGDPLINCAVWEPQPPQSPRHLKSYMSEIETQFPPFCAENRIENCVYYAAGNGKIFFLGQADKPLSYLLVAKADISECFFRAMRTLKVEEIQLLEGYPLLDIYDFNMEEFEMYADFFIKEGYSINGQEIGAALAKIRRSQKGKIDIPHSVENTFRIFHQALKGFEVPQVWPDDLLVSLSHVFGRLHELIVEKPLVGEYMGDESLEQYIGPLLEGSGLKRKGS